MFAPTIVCLHRTIRGCDSRLNPHEVWMGGTPRLSWYRGAHKRVHKVSIRILGYIGRIM
jgi:hypothetical protein